MNCLSIYYAHNEINLLAYSYEASCRKMLTPLRSTAFHSSYSPIFFLFFINKFKFSHVEKLCD